MSAPAVASSSARQHGSSVRRHPVVTFYVLAYTLAWITWLPIILSDTGLGVLRFSLPVAFCALATVPGPFLAAILVMAKLEGSAGVKKLLAPLGRWRVNVIWYLVALLLAFVVVQLAFVVALGGDALLDIGQRLPLVLVSIVPTVLVTGIVGGPLTEEPGWRGFALPRLQQQYGPLVGSLTVGLLWALWHLPILLTVSDWRLGIPIAVYLPAYVCILTAYTVLMAWVYNHSRRSLLMMVLMHSALNSSQAVLGSVYADTLGTNPLAALVTVYEVAAVAFALVALLVVVGTRGRLGFSPSHASSAEATQR